MTRSVHQFHHALLEGEPIREEVLALRALLRGAGFASEIFTEGDSGGADGARPLAAGGFAPQDLLLVHHEIAHDSAGRIASLPVRRVLVHHEPVPARFFSEDPRMADRVERGRRQRLFYLGTMEGALADSLPTARALARLGYDAPAMFPPLFGLAREILSGAFRPSAAAPLPPTVLSAGRFAPGAGHERAVEAFDRLARLHPDAALLLAGRGPSDAAFVRRLRRRVESSPFRSRIAIREGLAGPDLARCVWSARLCLSMSEHESFRPPLLEAFAAGVPVLAADAGAIAETMEGAGVLFARSDPDAVAAMMDLLLRQESLRRRILEEQRRRFERLDLPGLEARWLAWVERRFARPVDPSSIHALARRRERGLGRRRAGGGGDPPSVALVSTWRTRCGIAEYSRDLARAFAPGAVRLTILGNRDGERLEPDGPDVLRVWSRGLADYAAVRNAALERGIDTVHFQFHPGFYPSYRELSCLVEDLKADGRRVVLTIHLLAFHGEEKSLEALRPALASSDLLLVHSDSDLEKLREAGLGDRAFKIAFGGRVFPQRRREPTALALGLGDRRVFASFGFALPHKGILEAIEATAILRAQFPSILFLALASARPEEVSPEYLARCRARVTELGMEDHVWLVDSFLSEPEIELLLGAAEVVVLPYLETKETASAAIRFPLGAGRATITTKQPIFTDVRAAVLQIPSADPGTIAEAVARLLGDPPLRERLESEARRYAGESSWPAAAEAHAGLYRALLPGSPATENPRPPPAG